VGRRLRDWRVASWLNSGSENVVTRLGGAAPQDPRGRHGGSRYLLLAPGAYAILSFSSISVTAALVGLFWCAWPRSSSNFLSTVYAR